MNKKYIFFHSDQPVSYRPALNSRFPSDNFEDPGDRRIQHTEAIATFSDFHIGFVVAVHHHPVAQETICVEDIEFQLAIVIPSLVS
jgi:hypothetical protein